jgi:HSP20 family protein
MAIVRWEPFRDLVSLQDRLNRVFDDSLRGLARPGEEDWGLGGSWAPPVDIYEHEGNIVLSAVPASTPNVDVRLENNVLTHGEQVRRRGEAGKLPSGGRVTAASTAPSRSWMVDQQHIKAISRTAFCR